MNEAKINLILRGLTALLNLSTDMKWLELTFSINKCFDVVNPEYHKCIKEAQEKKQHDLSKRLEKIIAICNNEMGIVLEVRNQIKAAAKGE